MSDAFNLRPLSWHQSCGAFWNVGGLNDRFVVRIPPPPQKE